MSMLVSVFPLLMALSIAQASVVAPPIMLTPIVIRNIVTPAQALASGVGEVGPPEAIMRAADAGPARLGVRAVFAMPVRRAEKVGKRFFLNSEADYRDQRNLSVAIESGAYRLLRDRFGKKLDRAFLGRHLRVYGLARRVQISFGVNGRPTGLYYYQTHVTVTDPAQIEFIG